MSNDNEGVVPPDEDTPDEPPTDVTPDEVTYPLGLVLLYGVYPNAVVTLDDVIPVMNPESLLNPEILMFPLVSFFSALEVSTTTK